MKRESWKSFEGLFRAMQALWFPLLVIVVLRHFTHAQLGIGIISGTFIRKFFVPLLVLYFLGFHFSYAIHRPLFRWNIKCAIASIISAFIWCQLSLAPLAAYRLLGPPIYVWVWFFLGITTVLLSLSTTIDFAEVRRLAREYPHLFLLGALSTAPIVLVAAWENQLGGILARMSSFLSCNSLKLAGMDVSCPPNIISHRLFTVLVNPPCSGIDVLSLFVAVFCIFSMLAWDLIGSWRSWAKFFTVGILYALALNVIRLVILFVVAIHLSAKNLETIRKLELFHQFHGMALYSIFLCSFFIFLGRRLVRTE